MEVRLVCALSAFLVDRLQQRLFQHQQVGGDSRHREQGNLCAHFSRGHQHHPPIDSYEFVSLCFRFHSFSSAFFFLPIAALNSTVVRDIVGYSSSSIASMGDISSDDLRQVLIELTLPPARSPRKEGDRCDLIYYRLSFTLAGDSTASFIQGTIWSEFSGDEARLAVLDNDVQVATAIATASAIDNKVYDLLAGNRLAEARAEKRRALVLLKEVQPIDQSGFVRHLIALGEAAEKSMAESRVDVQAVRKAVHWTGGASIVHRKCF
jgi:hypothetical protein